jgi:hypothetical protein
MNVCMKRSVFTVALALTFLVALAVPAFADYPPAGTTQAPEVLGKTLRAAPGTAFTGSTVLPLAIVALALLVLGTGLVLVSRRARNSTGS